MLKVILRRMLQTVPVLLVVLTITFVLTRMIPGDPALAILGEQATPEMVAKVTEELGLNDSIPQQFVSYIGKIATGDFGTSFAYNRPVTSLLADRLPATLQLALVSLFFAVIFGLAIGIYSATRPYSKLDYAFTVGSLVGVSIPRFWLALLLVLTFSVNLGWLPSFGSGRIEKGLWDVISYMILPCICLAVGPTATFARITRSSMMEVVSNDYIRSLRARGIPTRSVLWKHALKNALPPIVTVFGLQLANAFTGAILTESIFSWPGMGSLIVNAINNRDYSLIQGSVVLVAIAFAVINMAVDVVYMLINPKYADNALGKA